jgi:effector-binding domain-containing protein
MKYLKILGWILLLLLILFAALGTFMSKEIDVAVSREIKTPSQVVYNVVNDLTTQTNWNPWLKEDETMELTFSDITTGEGASYSWTSKEGTGSQTITSAIPHQSINMNVVFDDEEPSQSPITFKSIDNGTEVTWAFQGKIGFPYNIMGPFIRRSIKSSYKDGLKMLEGIAEERWKDGTYMGYEIKVTSLPERNFIIRRDEVNVSDMQQFYATNLGSLFQAVQKAGQEMDGMPSGLFYNTAPGNGKIDMAAGIPVKEEIAIKNTGTETIPEGEGLEVDYYGDYSGLPTVHKAIEAYMKDRGLIHNAPFIEEYLTDPGEEKDSNKWLTKVYYYLADTGK